MGEVGVYDGIGNASFEVKLCFSIGNFHHLILFIFQLLGDHSDGDTNSLLFKVLQKWVGVSDTTDYFFETKFIKKTFHASGKFLDEVDEVEAYQTYSYTPTSPIYSPILPTSSSP